MNRMIALGLLGLLLGACVNDPCEGVACLNDGICVDGSCDCPEGFIGPDCGIVLDPCINKDCDAVRTDSCLALNSNEARCVCLPGFEGDKCENRWEDKFLGSYSCVEDCEGTQVSFSLSIVDGPNPRTLALENFHNQSGVATKLVAELLGAKVLDMEPQFMAYGIVNGGGSLESDGSIGLSYQIITTTPDTLTCVAVLTPQ
ncbi:MAG: hypothetical protein AAF927_24955 [Bacteroidota bacterium]